jgi:hypothetical protein
VWDECLDAGFEPPVEAELLLLLILLTEDPTDDDVIELVAVLCAPVFAFFAELAVCEVDFDFAPLLAVCAACAVVAAAGVTPAEGVDVVMSDAAVFGLALLEPQAATAPATTRAATTCPRVLDSGRPMRTISPATTKTTWRDRCLDSYITRMAY